MNYSNSEHSLRAPDLWRFSLVVGAMLLAGCGTAIDAKKTTKSGSTTQKTDAYQIDLWPQRAVSPPRNAKIEKRVMAILASMSLEEKVGQIVQPELKYVTPEDVKTYHLGSVLNGGGTTPNNDKYASVDDWASLADQFYQASVDESDGNVGIPLIWGSDAIHGNNNLYGATLFPHNIGLGAANDPKLIREIGKITALEVAATGVDWTFGPTVAVVRDTRWGRTYESYSENPDIVLSYAKEMVRGIQGSELVAGEYQTDNVVSTAKHFIGDGGTTLGIDRGDTEVSEQELINIHAAGYISALDSNVLTTMASFNSWNGTRLHGHRYLLTDVLKGRLGFDGFVVSDWNGHSHVDGCSNEQCAAAVNAGVDMVMVPQDWQAFYKNTLQDVKDGNIPQSRLDDAVARILRVKLYAGLFDAGPVTARKNVGDESLVGRSEHRQVAREAVRKSLVLLKNNKSILPISPSANILIAGDAAHNIGKQSGGWTLTWQGTGNTNQDFPGATSVFQGFEQAIKSAGGKVHLSESGDWTADDFDGAAKPDVAVVVFGEEPYAEWHGDISSIEYQNGNKRDIKLLESLQKQGIPVVSVFITGRPLWVNTEINASDAFVVAWLPGSEGAGIADVLLSNAQGKVEYDFQGRLPFSWPNNVSQAVLNVGESDYQPLFEYGYGLDYTTPREVGLLSADNSQQAKANLEDLWVFVSRVMSPWEVHLTDHGAEAVTVSGNTAVSGEDENLKIMSVDKASQEDSRQIVWKGLRAASLAISAPVTQDLSQYKIKGSALEFQVKLNTALTGDLILSMGCGAECGQGYRLNKLLTEPALGEWQNVSLDLSCFANQDAAFDQVSSIFELQSSTAADLSLANLKLVPSKAPNLSNNPTINCE